MKYLFGPVSSRRLGLSLGVDLVPYKVCTLSCIYCESGDTTNLTVKRDNYIPVDEVINELEAYLSTKPELDYVTFSGQGEPTLNSGLGKVIRYIKDNHPHLKLALITNGTLFYDEDLRKEAAEVDLILPSLDAVSDDLFVEINRPADELKDKNMVDGLAKMKQEMKSTMWLEVFICPGINDTPEELQKLKDAILKVNPDQVQLNTLDRPGSVDWIKPLDYEKLEEIAEFLKPLNVEIISRNKMKKTQRVSGEEIRNKIIKTIWRRPVTKKDLLAVFEIHPHELDNVIEELVKEKIIYIESLETGDFIKPVK